jgi:protein ImuB
MLWIALHFPMLPLEIFSRSAAAVTPLAVFEKQGNRARVIACNASAGDRGVQAGMAVSAAQALADGLVVRARDPAAERESLAGIAAWAGRFTPSVSVQPPAGLLLEVASCLRLHRGLDRLLPMMYGGLDEMGYAAALACAPTAHGAWLLALSGVRTVSGAEVVIREAGELEKILGQLPVRLLDQPPEVLSGLEMVGAHTVGDCLRLPRAGMARRFGAGLLDELDRARGALPEAREFYVPPDAFARRMELPATVHEAEALQFAARRLLPELEGYLSLRQAGVQECELVCRHEAVRAGAVAPTVITLGFAKPTRDLARMQLLLRETLARTRLSAPVYAIALEAQRILPLDGANSDMFREGEETEDGSLLLERLRIRLGKEAVFGITPYADHRPERAWRRYGAGEAGAAGEGTVSSDAPPRPLWLLPRPVPCREGRLVLKSGPERIESGWWDGRDAVRDYYVAQDGQGARLWVYCDRINGEWFVHGLFA